LGLIIPEIISKHVVFPDPLLPLKPIKFPFLISKLFNLISKFLLKENSTLFNNILFFKKILSF